MMRIGLACLLLGLVFGSASGQGEGGSEMGDYSSMQIDAGVMKGSFSGSISELTDGVRIRLLSNKEGVDPLPISARNMYFTWEEGASRPSKIVMEGEVDIRHPEAHVNSRKAEWNFETGELVFTGNPIVNQGEPNEMSGEKMVINFQTNEFTAFGVKVRELNFREAAAEKRDPALLTEADIGDWAGLLNAIKAQAGSDAPSPGKQVIAQIDEELRDALVHTATDVLITQKKVLLKQLNGVIRKPGFYSEAAWKGIELDSETTGLLKKEALSSGEQTRLNRLLLCAAWPNHIAKPAAS